MDNYTKKDQKPIFLVTHPRACSTAFERVFMTLGDQLECVHEPFGLASYYGPERIHSRFTEDLKKGLENEYAAATYKSVIDQLDAKDKRLFIKDMAQAIIPPHGKKAQLAFSFLKGEPAIGDGHGSAQEEANGIVDEVSISYAKKGVGTELGNPTLIPEKILGKFHFTFLIRHPRSSVPSYYRCTLPPLVKKTEWRYFEPYEMGYLELRVLFDYLRSTGQVGPDVAGHAEKSDGSEKAEICVIDADDLLDNPRGVIKAYCNSVGLKYNPKMLLWDSEEDHNYAVKHFEGWPGFHEDAIQSTELRARDKKSIPKTPAAEDTAWIEKYGQEAAKMIRETVDENIAHYEYLKQFALNA